MKRACLKYIIYPKFSPFHPPSLSTAAAICHNSSLLLVSRVVLRSSSASFEYYSLNELRLNPRIRMTPVFNRSFWKLGRRSRDQTRPAEQRYLHICFTASFRSFRRNGRDPRSSAASMRRFVNNKIAFHRSVHARTYISKTRARVHTGRVTLHVA